MNCTKIVILSLAMWIHDLRTDNASAMLKNDSTSYVLTSSEAGMIDYI